MKKIIATLSAALLAVTPVVLAQETINPSSRMVSKTLAISAFDEIDISRVNLVVNIGPATGQALVNGPDNIVENLEIDIQSGKLTIGLPDQYTVKGKPKTTVEITIPSFKEIEASLAANVEISGTLKTNDELELTAGTAASIKMGTAMVSKCDIEVATAASVNIGKLTTTKDVDIDAATAASVKIGTLYTPELEIEAATAATVKASAGEAANADIESFTSALIDVAGMQITVAKAQAATGANIKCNISRFTKRSATTGGKIQNN